VSKFIPYWLFSARSEAHRLFKVSDELLGKVLKESEVKHLISIGHSELYREYQRAAKEAQEADKKWAELGKRWENMTPDEQYEELKCEHPEEAQEVRPDVFLGETMDKEYTATAIVCGVCDELLQIVPESED
jgi:hypothetical protein